MTDYSETDEKVVPLDLKKKRSENDAFFYLNIHTCNYFSTEYSFAYYNRRWFHVLLLHCKSDKTIY